MFKYICNKCSKEFLTRKREQKFCSKSCANSNSAINRKVPDRSIFINGIDKLSSYILGIILSDGCLSYDKHSKRYRITISMNDYELIEFLRSRYSPTKKLYEYNNAGGKGTTYTFITTNDYDVYFLQQLGVNERKSKSLIFPQVEQIYMNDMIRGIFDGDGSVYVNRTKSNNKLYEYLNASITTGSELFADGLMKILNKNSITAHKVKDSRKYKMIWYVKVYSKADMKKFHDYIYRDCILYLRRKKNLFDMMI